MAGYSRPKHTLLTLFINLFHEWSLLTTLPCSVATKLRRSSKLQRFLSEDPSLSSSSVHFQIQKNLWSFEDLEASLQHCLVVLVSIQAQPNSNKEFQWIKEQKKKEELRKTNWKSNLPSVTKYNIFIIINKLILMNMKGLHICSVYFELCSVSGATCNMYRNMSFWAYCLS